MLVLGRKVGQTICIGPDVEVTVMQVRGENIRLAIKAPPNVAVDRAEVALAKRAAKSLKQAQQ